MLKADPEIGHVTRRLPVWGGDPGDKQFFRKHDVHARRHGLRRIEKLVKGDPKPLLKLVVRPVRAKLADAVAHLPANAVCGVDMVPFVALYQQEVAGCLRHSPTPDPLISQATGALHGFPSIANDRELYQAVLRPLWDAWQRDKALKKKGPEELFRQAMVKMWPLLHCRVTKEHTVATLAPDLLLEPDPKGLAARRALLDRFMGEEVTALVMASTCKSAPFSTAELMVSDILDPFVI